MTITNFLKTVLTIGAAITKDITYMAEHPDKDAGVDADGLPIFDPAGAADYRDDKALLDHRMAERILELRNLMEYAERGYQHFGGMNTYRGKQFNLATVRIDKAILRAEDFIGSGSDRVVDAVEAAGA